MAMEQMLSFEQGSLALAEIERLNADIWVRLAFDESARAALKRDGLDVDRMRLTGPNPFRFGMADDRRVIVSAQGHADADQLLDLWRVHFLHRIRERAGTKAG
jgi:hypothetical protein